MTTARLVTRVLGLTLLTVIANPIEQKNALAYCENVYSTQMTCYAWVENHDGTPMKVTTGECFTDCDGTMSCTGYFPGFAHCSTERYYCEQVCQE
jgi:hypothetical protein